MRTNRVIETTIGAAIANFSLGLEHRFCPAVGDNGFHEANIGFQVGHAFCDGRTSRHAAMQVPFQRDGAKSVDTHFDTLLIDYKTRFCAVLECKRLFSSDQNKSIVADIQRIRNPNHLSFVSRELFYEASRPSSWHGIVIAEYWERVGGKRSLQDVRNWWVLGKGDNLPSWPQDGYPQDWNYKASHLIRNPKGRFADDIDWDVYWLYAYGKLETPM